MNACAQSTPRAPLRLRGLSLVELLVAVAIGMLIVTAMAILFANNSRSRSETERASQKIENGRYALEMVGTELHHAGYFSTFDPRKLTAPAVLPDPCNTDVASAAFQSAITLHVQGYDEVTSTTLSCLSDVKPATDVVVTRRASSCLLGTAGCTTLPGFQASSCNSNTELGSANVSDHYRLGTSTATFTLMKHKCAAVAESRRFLLRIYYVANNDKPGDGIPTLKRVELNATGFSSPTSLVQGVQDLQVEYGLDTNNDGAPDVYVADPNDYLTCNDTTTPTCVGHWLSAVSAKVYVLSRNVDGSPGHDDTKAYRLGGKAVPAFRDAYKRSVFQETIRLQNPSGRRLSPS